jgi:hypothetical protein
MRVRIRAIGSAGLVVKAWRHDPFTLSYAEILTAERERTPRRSLLLHTRTSRPLRVLCGSGRRAIEDELRDRGVRVVDCWGAIIAPTLLDFEEELAREPVRMRQSSDSA